MSALENYLKCPCKRFEPVPDAAPILAAYREARARGAKEGFTPVLLPANDEKFLDAFDWEEYKDQEAFREEMLAKPMADGKAWFEQAGAKIRKWGAEYGPAEDSEGSDEFAGIFDYGRPRRTIPLLLAEIPAKNPWEIFAWVPFGGWNECPMPEEHMAIAKYWYEKYGAVPAVITSDILEFSVPAPVGREEAMALAWEQYLYCPDIVDQGCESVGVLGDILSKSTAWFFWWD